MDSPILPDRAGEDGSREQEARYLRWGAELRFLAAAVALVGAIAGLVSHFEGNHHTQASAPLTSFPTAAPATGPAVYGDPTPAALVSAAKTRGQKRSVCQDETRPLPTTGAWTCHSSVPLDSTEIGRRAEDTGGPCTHRVVSDAGGSWNCWTRIAIPAIALHMPYAVPLMFGHVAPPAASSQDTMTPRVCRQESRASETHGAWTCVSWQGAPDGWRIVEPVDPGGPCSYRIADEETGVWSCQSGTARDARAP